MFKMIRFDTSVWVFKNIWPICQAFCALHELFLKLLYRLKFYGKISISCWSCYIFWWVTGLRWFFTCRQQSAHTMASNRGRDNIELEYDLCWFFPMICHLLNRGFGFLRGNPICLPNGNNSPFKWEREHVIQKQGTGHIWWVQVKEKPFYTSQNISWNLSSHPVSCYQCSEQVHGRSYPLLLALVDNLQRIANLRRVCVSFLRNSSTNKWHSVNE